MIDNSTFLGFDKKQIPLLSLLLAGFLMLAGMFYQLNANINALNANINALRAEMNANDNALRAEMNANINALRSEMNALRSETNADINAVRDDVSDLDSRIDVLSVEAAETNARIVNIEGRIENIERSLPAYAYVDERIDKLEREQARITELEREQARLNQLVADLVSAE